MSREMDIDQSKHDFQFTRNWFRNRNLATFRQYIHPEWAGKQIVYLEIGVFEGMSLVWMMQHVLTHPQARAVGIDPWLMTTKLDESEMACVERRAAHNIRPWLHPIDPDEPPYGGSRFWKASLVRGNSAEVLRRMTHKGYAGITKQSVNLCMIDGDHNRLAVYDDAVQVLKLMVPGGWMLFDDVENDHPKKDHVAHGLEMFKNDYKDKIKFLWKDRYMEAYQVL